MTSDMDHRGDRPPQELAATGTPAPARGCHSHPPALPLPSVSDFVLFCGLLTLWGAGGGHHSCTLRKGARET